MENRSHALIAGLFTLLLIVAGAIGAIWVSKKNIPLMKKWGVSISNPEAEFKLIDADSGGSILFREFSHYCI